MAAPIDVSVTLNPTTGDAPLAVAATPAATDPDALDTPVCTVDWGDGSTSTTDAGAAVAHTYPSPGQYTVAVTAELGDDSTDAEPVTVTVAAANHYPVVEEDGGVCVPWLTVTGDFSEVLGDAQRTALTQSAINVATRWLNDATGHQWAGPCTTFLRVDTGDDRACGPQRPRIRDGALDLSVHVTTPIRRVVELRVDGEVVDALYYRLDGPRLRASTGYSDGASPLIPWPVQYLDRQPGALDTWDVTVEHGAGPPEPLVRAARLLVEEIVKQVTGDEACALPSNAASVSRDGITITFTPPAPGRTGIRFVDDQISLYGPDAYGATPRRMFDPAATPNAEVYRYLRAPNPGL